MKRTLCCLVLGIAVFSLPAAAADPKAGGIKKCRDETGKWHYGDNAADACAKSKITVINDKGLTKKEIAAPPTEGELKQREAQKAELQRAEERAKEQAKQDEILLATYANEADIVFIRDRKLAQLESTIRNHQDTLNLLRTSLSQFETQAAAETKANKAVSENTQSTLDRTRNQISQNESAIVQKRQEQDAIRARAEVDIQRFRQLKGQQAAKSVKP